MGNGLPPILPNLSSVKTIPWEPSHGVYTFVYVHHINAIGEDEYRLGRVMSIRAITASVADALTGRKSNSVRHECMRSVLAQ